MGVPVVIVTYSVPAARLDETIDAVRAGGGASGIVVVDTGGRADPSDDGVTVIKMPNRGYGAAANLGMRHALDRDPTASAVALLNDDVTVRPGWLDPLLAELDASPPARIGAAQPTLLLAGTEPARINSLGVRLDRFGAGQDIGDGRLHRPGGVPADLAIFTGGAVVFTRRYVAETGGFDERYVLYYEDVDLALRGAELGWRYRLAPESVVDHDRGATTATLAERTRYLQERNRLWAAGRFGEPGLLARACWLSLRRLRHRPRRVHARALLAGLGGLPVRVVERRRARRR